ncbi:MAG: VOC family protein [Chitinophaga sp.]|uniref:VOC family protein n=1 Tax=Chitinophaga sp. TaxID=1869181 RepID=UPI001B2A98E9|nr:VOC family protein [Chitinophaga sp.]MBO9731311.1 VOC family protein [Chitinophaga sp.]
MAAVNPYLNFDGTCEEAFNLYKSAFGGEFVNFTRFGDSGPEACEDGEKDKIMHVSLPIGKNTILMGSDTPHTMPVVKGNQLHVAIQADSEQEADHLFASLSAGGQVYMPMGKAPWGAYFGMFVDKFGIQWMINFDYQP